MMKLCCFLLLAFHFNAYSFKKIIIDKNLNTVLIAREVYYIEDRKGNLEIKDIIHSNNFISYQKDVVDFQVSESTFWLKFTVVNVNNPNSILLEIIQPSLQDADFYYPDANNYYQLSAAGQKYPFNSRKYKQSTNFIFDLVIKPGEEKTYFLKIRGHQQILVPLKVITKNSLDATISNRNFWFGIYCGIILVMVLYNLFLYISIRDRSYIYYVLHTLFVGLTQASLLGYAYQYFWPGSSWFGSYSNFLFTCLVSIVGIQFLTEFLHLKVNARKIFYVLKTFQVVYLAYLFTSLAGYYSFTYAAILPTQSLIAFFILAVSIYSLHKGFVGARSYLIAWSSLMLGIIVYVARDFGLLPYNGLTAYSLVIGSAAEITLLSFALADRINIYKMEKEKSQQAELAALLENQRMVREQNVLLEKKVLERTHELNLVNEDLEAVLKDLKDREGQLVESEKMAALGQLTAGIAHEINNPINFVTSNVAPLQRDIETITEMISDIEKIGLSENSVEEKQSLISVYKAEIDYDYLKTEISHLLRGISEGAGRTAEIVKGLRIFSRVDESDLKQADINEGLDSTIILVNNMLSDKIKLIKDFGTMMPIECYPGKLNQVFLNIISNAIHAISKQHPGRTEGVLKIKTRQCQVNTFITITDNGTGMDERTKKKVFEPFFTTKEVGEGTGLGMSIAYHIIKKHNGHIIVNSTLGEGTEFIIQVPIVHETTAK